MREGRGRLCCRRSRRMQHDHRQSQARGSSMPANPVLWELDERGVATLTLNRPEANNAYDAALFHGVLSAMAELASKPQLPVVGLKGTGKHFQPGAALNRIK